MLIHFFPIPKIMVSLSPQCVLRLGRGCALWTHVLLLTYTKPHLLFLPFQTSPFSWWFVSKRDLSSSPAWSLTARVILIFLLQVLGSDTESELRSVSLCSSHHPQCCPGFSTNLSLFYRLSGFPLALCQVSAGFPSILLPHQFICNYFCTACSQNFLFGISFLFLLISVFPPASPSYLQLLICPAVPHYLALIFSNFKLLSFMHLVTR